ncbi:low-density lipoprotein receptor-related protein 2-like [Patiria miniata]|uniref:CUB domain-containing protein n=1 Tax=Patiria miniata TaxID=46514 RepID=A0A914A9B5_PATMI|nr:low-density lipoprotein receptor-related protein 2-like [Patiria miniata]XP_038060462.1 low-density lipoprotein receptor-related protein 2-like [Patiria miniata]
MDHCGDVSTITVTNGLPYVLQKDAEAYPYGQSCLWRVAATVGSRIRITVRDLDLSERSMLIFGQGDVINKETAFAVLSGSYARQTVTSNTNEVWITLQSVESSDIRFAIEIQSFEPMHAECGGHQFSCPLEDNCIPRDQVCDGIPQCPLHGDELACDLEGLLREPYHGDFFYTPRVSGSCADVGDYRCPKGGCISWMEEICDGKAHCNDLSDERNCYPCGKSYLLLSNSTVTSVPFQSINYPLPYPNDALCVWLVTADADRIVVLQCTRFHTERSKDNLIVGNGHDPSDENSQIMRLSGFIYMFRIISRGPKIWLKFQSNGQGTRKGFSATLSQEMPEGSCSDSEFQCRSPSVTGLTCLNAATSVCNGMATCIDGSDEENCGTNRPRGTHVFA